MATVDSNGGSNIYFAIEVLPAAVGTTYHMTLCTGLYTGVYNTDKIVWNSLSGWWAFTTTACGTGYEYSEFGQTDSIKAGSKDWIESYDNSTADFSFMNAYTECEYCMLYWTGTQWN